MPSQPMTVIEDNASLLSSIADIYTASPFSGLVLSFSSLTRYIESTGIRFSFQTDKQFFFLDTSERYFRVGVFV